jgi:enamine deaminase RidA (YjgF/YER057c/UK114 family)
METSFMSLLYKLKEMGLNWPDEHNPPSYFYFTLYGDKSLSVRSAGELVFASGLPIICDKPLSLGRLGAELTLQEGYQCARRAAANALYEINLFIGDWRRIEYITQMTGFVASAPEFIDQPKVLNGASDVFIEVLGEKGEHSRAAIGCVSLPGNNPVQVSVIAKITKGVVR